MLSVRAYSILLVKISALTMSLVDVGSPLTFSANFCSEWFLLVELQEHWQLFRLNSPIIFLFIFKLVFQTIDIVS